MQSIDILPPTPDANPSSGNGTAWNVPARKQEPAEKFDVVMGRTLAHSSRSAPDHSDPSDKTSASHNRRQRRPADAANPPSMAGAEGAAAAVSPAPAPAAEGAASPSDTNSQIDVVPTSGQGGGSCSATSEDSVPGGENLSDDNPGDASPLPAQQPPALVAGSSQPVVPGLKSPLETDPAAAGSQAVASKTLLTPTSGDNTQTARQTQHADSTGPPAGTGRLPLPPPDSPGNAEIAGISSAKHELAMQKPEKMNEFSASAEQNLPIPPAGVAGEDAPVKVTSALNSLPQHEYSGSALATDASASGSAYPTQTISSAILSLPSSSETTLRSVERANDLMSLHAFRLRDSGADSLQVVIKPGSGLQLSLDLQMRDGNVEMRATLHHGDFDSLNQHWSELQQQLESRGIRLGPLVSDNPTPAGGQNLFQQPDDSKEQQDAAQPGAVAEFALGSVSKAAATTKTMKTLHGWESWA